MDENRITQVNRFQELDRAEAPAGIEPQIVDVAPEEVPHLLDYWDLILKRRWVVLSCLLVVFSTVAIGTLKQKPVYRGDVEIEIKPEEPQILTFREIAQAAPTVDLDAYRETQYKVIQSRTLAERVIDDLHLYRYPEFYRSRLLFGLIQRDPKQFPPKGPAAPDKGSDYYRNTVAHFQDSVDVNPVRRSNLVEVSFYSNDPELAATIANKLADDYIYENLQASWDETAKAGEWLNKQLKDLKIKLEDADNKLQDYARKNSIVFVNEKQALATARLQELQTEYTKAQADRFAKEAAYSMIKSGHQEDLPDIIDNRVIQDLEEKKADLEQKYSDLTATVKPEFPTAQRLKKQIDTLQRAIETQTTAVIKNLQDQYKAAQTREKYLAQAVDEAKQEVNDLGEKGITYNILKRDVDSNQALYDALLQRMKEANVSAGVQASNIRVVDPAIVPAGPARPRVALNFAIGIMLGLGLGVGLAFFQDYLDKTLKSADDVEHLLRLPSLGILPRFSSNGHAKAADHEIVHVGTNGDHPMAPAVQTVPEVVEAFRSLRTSILLSASPVPRLLLITSSLPSEGKTTTSVNLGATLASLGNRVIIVDCDMRRPSCHRSTGVENYPGFVQCLTGHVELEKAILPVPGVPNLNVIPCGPIPPNPAEVLSSPLTGQLLRQLRNQFEYVLVDSPPLLSVADSRILATITDAVVLVSRAHSTPYDVVRRARSLLYGTGARVLGVALNDVDLRQGGLGYKQYQYGYGYGAAGEAGVEGDSAAQG